MSVRVEGIDAISKKLDDLIDTREQERQVGKACALVERAAKEKAPKDTGELRRSISSRVEVNSGEVTGIVFSPLEYAPYVEYGTGLFAEVQGRTDVPWHYQDDEGNWHSTSGMNPQPYMRPALNENRDAILRILKGALKGD